MHPLKLMTSFTILTAIAAKSGHHYTRHVIGRPIFFEAFLQPGSLPLSMIQSSVERDYTLIGLS